MNALIGFSGFVGSTLLKQTKFESTFRSTNIADIAGGDFDTVVCAGAPAQKWFANKDPGSDYKKIHDLITHLKNMNCKKFILISTVDVFSDPAGIDETSTISEEGLNAYGLHRRILEKFVIENFSNHLIVRLPGLVGPGLRKNIIFDLLNNNNIMAIDSRNIFQFYPMVNLWYDIQIAVEANLNLIHLTAAPVKVGEIAELGFAKQFTNHLADDQLAMYDMRTMYSKLYGSSSHYQYSERETIQAVRAFAQSELLSIYK